VKSYIDCLCPVYETYWGASPPPTTSLILNRPTAAFDKCLDFGRRRGTPGYATYRRRYKTNLQTKVGPMLSMVAGILCEGLQAGCSEDNPTFFIRWEVTVPVLLPLPMAHHTSVRRSHSS